MGRKNKLMKFAEMLDYPNVFQNFEYKNPRLTGIENVAFDFKGRWSEGYFKNNNPLILELACGGGEYSLGLAGLFPNRNLIGIDVKGARIYKGSSRALSESINNVAFVRTRIEQLDLFFDAGEVEEIWITFPDPFLRESKENRRLTSEKFLNIYRKVLKKGGIVHLKTDDETLYNFTIEALSKIPDTTILINESDIYSKELNLPELDIKTYYERMHLEEGKSIKYVRFMLGK